MTVYESVTLSNGAIVHATSNFHNREWFSEVAISMSSEESDDYISDQGVCYGQVIYMFKIIEIMKKYYKKHKNCALL